MHLQKLLQNKIVLFSLSLAIIILTFIIGWNLINNNTSPKIAQAGSTFVQQINKDLAADLDSFVISGETYFAATDKTDGTVEIYKWNTSTNIFDSFQVINSLDNPTSISSLNNGTDQRLSVALNNQINVYIFNGTTFVLESSLATSVGETVSLKMFSIGTDVMVANCFSAFPYGLNIYKINLATLDTVQNLSFNDCHSLDFGSFEGNDFLFAANRHSTSPDLGIYIWNGTQFVYQVPDIVFGDATPFTASSINFYAEGTNYYVTITGYNASQNTGIYKWSTLDNQFKQVVTSTTVAPLGKLYTSLGITRLFYGGNSPLTLKFNGTSLASFDGNNDYSSLVMQSSSSNFRAIEFVEISGTTYSIGNNYLDGDIYVENTEFLVDLDYSKITVGTCSPDPQVLSQSVSCVLQTNGNNFKMPAPNFLYIGIGNATGIAQTTNFDLCTLSAPYAANQIVTCNTVPTSTNTTTGSKVIWLGGFGGTNVGTLDLIYPPIENSNISSISCTPSSTEINTSVNCTITTNVDLSNLSGSVNVRIGSSGSIVNCPVTGSGTTLTCNNVPVGSVVGTFPAQFNASGSGSTFEDGNNVDVTLPNIEIVGSDIISVQSCTPAYPTPLNQGVDTINCNLKLTDNILQNYILPSTTPLTFKIDNSSSQITCNQTAGVNCSIDNNTDTILITSIPTTNSNLGSQPLRVSDDGTNFIDFADTAFIIRDLQTSDIPTLNIICNSGVPAFTNTVVNCTFELPANTTLPADFKLTIGNGAVDAGGSLPSQVCDNAILPLTGIVCTSVPTGTLLGIQAVNGQIGSGTSTPSGETIFVLDSACSLANPCALQDSSLTYSPIQNLAKRYGLSLLADTSDLILTLKDPKLEQPGFTTTCTIKYKFRTDTSYTTLSSNQAYDNFIGCESTLLKENQLLFNVDFEIVANTTNGNISRNYLLYSNYDFKAGAVGVTNIEAVAI